MKKYELVIFGFTFLSMGLCSAYKGNALIIEPKSKPGYEFIDAFHPGDVREYLPKTDEGKKFYAYLKENNLTDDTYILRWTPFVSGWIETKADYLFLTDIINVKKWDDGYIITIFNSMGKSEIFAKNIIDTRATEYCFKTINFLTKGKNANPESHGISLISVFGEYSIYQVELSSDDDYPQARKKVIEAFGYLKSISSDISLVAIADEMYKKASFKSKEISSGYIKSPSSYYDNPVMAFDEGAGMGSEIL